MWESFCEALQDFGRSGALFIFAMLAVSVALPFWYHGGPFALGALLLVFLIRTWRLARRHNGQAWNRLGKLPPLSQNDWRAARSKLLKQKNQP